MISSKDLVLFINPPKYLSVLIAYTVAADVLPIFEKHFPKDLRPRKAVEASKMYLDGYAVDAAAYVDAPSAHYAPSDVLVDHPATAPLCRWGIE